LQDFAVEVRPVNIGIDVVSVAQGFKPDIIFIDVLLQKKNGYEVSSELKQHNALKDIPVVLMWSGFMELDEDKFQASMANAQLEKPFDVSALRKLVGELVPRTSSQRLSQFLSFPKMPELEERPPAAPPAATANETVDEEDFKQVSIPKMKKAGDEKFRLNMNPEELDPEALPVDYKVPGEKSEDADEFSMSPPPKAAPRPEIAQADLEMEELVEVPLEDERPAPRAAVGPTSTTAGLSAEQLEKIIREQSADVIESVVWKVVPELAKQIIERELNKLLKERDSHPY